MNYTVHKTFEHSKLDLFIDQFVKELNRNGNKNVTSGENLNFVLNVTNADNPIKYCRKHQQELVLTIILLDKSTEDIKTACFIALVKTISNMVIGICPKEDDKTADVYYITPEAGFVKLEYDFERIYKCIYPVINSHFVLRNEISVNLPDSSQIKSKEVDDLVYHAHELGKLGHLPAPFPLEKYLDEDLIKQLFRLYEIKGISYGNLSVRSTYNGFNGHSFWMTARGSDKAHLKRVGHDILLVTGYNKLAQRMQVSVPPDYDPRVRVSVDAIEHYMIYSTFPSVGAIVHIHAWIEGIQCTDQNFPCGTFELANSVVELLKTTNNPDQAVVGLKNHGITITGLSIYDIFSRIKGKLQTKVPMFE